MEQWAQAGEKNLRSNPVARASQVGKCYKRLNSMEKWCFRMWTPMSIDHLSISTIQVGGLQAWLAFHMWGRAVGGLRIILSSHHASINAMLTFYCLCTLKSTLMSNMFSRLSSMAQTISHFIGWKLASLFSFSTKKYQPLIIRCPLVQQPHRFQ